MSGEDEEKFDELIARILAATDAGQVIDREEGIRTHPEFAAQLIEFFYDLAVIGRLEEQFGRYVLLEKLGEGGQGEVWKASQSNPPRLVALKILRGGFLVSADEVRRFR